MSIRRSLPFLVLGLSAAISSPARSQTSGGKATSLTVDLGLVNAAGNSEVSTFNVADKFVARTPGKGMVFTQTLKIVYGRSDGEKNAENYRAQVRADLELSPHLSLFGLGGWDRNTFGGIARRFEETIGLAFQAIHLPNDELSIEAGLSAFQQRNTVADAGVFDDNFKAGRAGLAYKHVFNSATFISQSLEFFPNFDDATDWRLDSESTLVAPISTHIGVKLGYVVRFDNLPGLVANPTVPGERLKKTDRFLTAGLTVSY